MIVSAQGVTKKFGNVVAVRDVNIEVAPGELVVLTGGNGSGKTTLLRMLAGLTRPNSGVVKLGDKGPREARGQVGFLGHESYVYPYLTPAENLSFYSKMFGCEDRGMELITRLGLKEKADAPAHTLSRGQMQRLGIARALLHRPEVLLLDEPLTGLDSDARSTALEAILEASASTVISTHEPQPGMQGRVEVLEDGRLL